MSVPTSPSARAPFARRGGAALPPIAAASACARSPSSIWRPGMSRPNSLTARSRNSSAARPNRCRPPQSSATRRRPWTLEMIGKQVRELSPRRLEQVQSSDRADLRIVGRSPAGGASGGPDFLARLRRGLDVRRRRQGRGIRPLDRGRETRLVRGRVSAGRCAAARRAAQQDRNARSPWATSRAARTIRRR